MTRTRRFGLRASLWLLTSLVGGCADNANTADMNGGPVGDGIPVIPHGDGGAQPIAVSGLLRGFIYDDAFAGATVKVGDQSVTTGADGAFTLSQVKPPYDLKISYSFAGKDYLTVVEGLTRPDPVVELGVGATGTTARIGSVAGTLTGPTFPLGPSDYIQVVAVGSGGGTASTILGPGSTDGNYNLLLTWRGGTSVTRNLYALHYSVGGDSQPTSFHAYGKRSVTVNDNDMLTGKDFGLSSAGTLAVTASVSSASPLTGMTGTPGYRFEPGCSLDFARSVTGNFTAALPVLTGLPTGSGPFVALTGSFPSSAGAAFARRQLGGNGAATLSTALPLATRPNPTTWTAGTEFEWDSRESGLFSFTLSDSGGAARLTLITRRNKVSLPEGYTPTSGNGTWRVTYMPAYANADAAAVPQAFSQVSDSVSSPSRTISVP